MCVREERKLQKGLFRKTQSRIVDQFYGMEECGDNCVVRKGLTSLNTDMNPSSPNGDIWRAASNWSRE